MHEELIDTLRLCESNTHCKECPYYNKIKQTEECKKLLVRAADAMEQLEKDVSRAKEWASFWEKEATEALKKFQVAVASKPRWILVTERLPEAGERVMCYCRANIYEVMKMRTDGDWVHDTNHIYMHSFVTHWMPLPTPPKEETE